MIKYIYPILLLALVWGLIRVLRQLRRQTSNQLEEILYIQNDVDLYLKLLMNPRLGFIYRKSTLLIFRLNGLLIGGNHRDILSTIQQLDGLVLTQGERLEVEGKKLSYFCETQRAKEAKESLDKIEILLAKSKSSRRRFLLEECRLIFAIYILRDTTLLPELEKEAEAQVGARRTLTLYRIAKLQHFADDDKSANETLLKAKSNRSASVWDSIIDLAIQDPSILDRK